MSVLFVASPRPKDGHPVKPQYDSQFGSQHVSVIVICVFAACVVCALDEFDAAATRLHWIYLDENWASIRLPLLEKNLKPPKHFMKDE